MRKLMNLVLVTAFVVVLAASPAMAKKAPDRLVVDGVTLAQVKPNSQIEPFYPATARTSKIYAQVILAAEVNEKGRVGQIDVVASSSEGLGFEQSASDAVRNWRFHPAMEDGKPIESVTVIRLTFTPPNLRRPDGFVIAERSPNLFNVEMFKEQIENRTWTQKFKEGASLAAGQDDYYFPAELPPCTATRAGNECIYNKQDLVQFGGPGPTIGLPPHTVRRPGGDGGD